MIRLLSSIVLSFTVCGLALAGEAAPPPLPKVPDGFKIELVVAAPQINAPTAVAISPNGDIYIGEDENNVRGNKPATGRIKRLLEKDGKIDLKPFFEGCNGPRGMCFVDGVLYTVHTPTLVAYHNEKGEDKPSKVETLITGLGPPVEKVPPDHSINGVRMGMDGWLYISCGDQGVPNGEGTDGSKVQLHAGGVVRVRPDGSELEMYASGTRNCYDMALDPFFNGFARDNTNDGGGWNVRFHHLTQSAEYGYPSFYKNFQDEMVTTLADYGGGSGTGAIFIHEPNFPEGFGNHAYTCDWGRGWIYKHILEPNGSTFKVKQEEFIKFKRPTDMDVDGRSRIIVADWGDWSYGKSPKPQGLIYKVTPTAAANAPAFPDLNTATEKDLLKYLVSPSAVLRLNAQCKLLKIGAKPDLVAELEKITLSDAPLYARVGTLFTIKQLLGVKAQELLLKFVEKKELKEYALRALTDRSKEVAGLKAELFVKALSDTDPRVRVQAAICLGRLGDQSAAAALVPLTADSDGLLAHVALKSLRTLKAYDACLAVVDAKQHAVADGALRTLRMIHEPQTVAGLKAKLDATTEPGLRANILKTIARLYYKEAPWEGSWWGIRPDTRGPYFKQAVWEESQKVSAILVAELSSNVEARQRVALDAIGFFRIADKDCATALTKISEATGPLQGDATRALIRSNALGKDALGVVEKIATNQATDATLRAQAVQALEFMQGMERAPVLFRIAEKADLPLETRAAAYAVLFKIKDKAVMEPLGKAWPDVNKAEALIQAVRNSGDEGQLKNVKQHADSANAKVKLAALSCQAAFGDAGALDKLIGLCNGNDKTDALQALSMLSSGKLKPEDLGKMAEKIVALAEAAAASAPDAPATGDAVSAARMFAGDPRLAAENGPKLLARIPRPKGAAKLIAELPLEQVAKDVLTVKGDKMMGKQFFARQICVNCHTTSPDEKPKGPYLGDVGDKYSRKELVESITNPGANIAQGYEANIVLLKDGTRAEGFVGRETGDEIEIRNIAGEVKVIQKADIKKRAEQHGSLMPVGLVNTLTVEEFASLLAYLESLRTQ